MKQTESANGQVTRADMQTVVVEKAKLQETLTKNRAAHRQMFEEALEGYQARAVELLTEHIERIKTGSVEQVYVSLPAPADHTEDYDRAIATLEWTIFEEVELSISEFDMYVRDAWRWKREFTETNAMYSSPHHGGSARP